VYSGLFPEMKLSTFGSALVGLAVAHASTVEYSAVTGYFLQDEDSTDASTFDYVSLLLSNSPKRALLFQLPRMLLLVTDIALVIDSGELRLD
jgi:hypothetical protein